MIKELLHLIMRFFSKTDAESQDRQLTLPVSPDVFNERVLTPALRLLPEKMDTPEARVMLVTIALQESALAHRWQVVDRSQPEHMGPARGLLQFERGGGVYGVLNHVSSRKYAHQVCAARGIEPSVNAVYEALHKDDILAAAFGRLLLWTDPQALPTLGDSKAAWDLYMRCWRPGKPWPDKWPDNYKEAMKWVS